ncbi:putative Glycosyltransferase [Nitrospira japonica]|uniref:Putative Glycosyltransferase n=1 Tax=Nitrospira japonica TaxID=1325564 RepID=A0A1W1IA93_9BACT|nr:putative Glycosyltransferase [Nitrospira japonica]
MPYTNQHVSKNSESTLSLSSVDEGIAVSSQVGWDEQAIPAREIHVLVVSNHWGVKKQCSPAGVFVDRQVNSLENVGVRITTFDVGTSLSLSQCFKKWLKLRRLIDSIKPDVIHGRNGTIVGFMSTLSGRPSVVTFCGGDLLLRPQIPLLRQYLGFLLSNLAAVWASEVICVSEELHQTLWWRRRAFVIPDGVDLELFKPGPQHLARKELGWDLDRPIALFSIGGDREKLKGLELVEAAMANVRRQVPTAELKIISNVEPSRMPLYYRASDVLLFASLVEGSPNMVKEALACNLPIVSTPVGDVAERLADVRPSRVVPREPRVFGDAVVEILQTRERSNGRELVASLGLSHIAEQVRNVYLSLLGGESIPELSRLHSRL